MQVESKWRPSLAMVTAGMIATVLVLAIGGFGLVRLNAREPATIEIAIASLIALSGAGAIGVVFVRAILRPLRELERRAQAIGAGDRSAVGPLRHYGTRELAAVTRSFMDMATSLSAATDYLRTFERHVSHELKTPLTAMRGAAELMLDNPTMTSAEREKFLGNITSDVQRLSTLLDRLSDLARADSANLLGETSLAAVMEPLRSRFPDLPIDALGDLSAPLAMSLENAIIIFGHLFDNASRHGASAARLEAVTRGDSLDVTIQDDGAGVSLGNRDRVFDPFFTTRRADGGTGMGLAIVRSLLGAHGGAIALEESATGASFALRLPLAAERPARNLHKLP